MCVRVCAVPSSHADCVMVCDMSSPAGADCHLWPVCVGQHLYVPLAEVQVEREEEISASPYSRPEQPVLQTPAELLFAVRDDSV